MPEEKCCILCGKEIQKYGQKIARMGDGGKVFKGYTCYPVCENDYLIEITPPNK